MKPIIDRLPEEISEEMREWAEEWTKKAFLVYSRESVVIEPEIKMTMRPEDWAEHERQTRRKWGAVCHCSACNDEFIGGWEDGKILLTEGEDGCQYSGYAEWDEQNAIRIEEGYDIYCPLCGELIETVRKSNIRRERTYACVVGELTEIGKNTVLMTWLVQRKLYRDGNIDTKYEPFMAHVIEENGKITQYEHTDIVFGGKRKPGDRWKKTSKVRDPFLTIYHDSVSPYGRKIGGEMRKGVKVRAGTTGEKTGIYEYIKAGGEYPIVYMKLWKKQRNIEHLIKSELRYKVIKTIFDEVNGNIQYGILTDNASIEWADLREKKPSKMVGMSKAEMCDFAGRWSVNDLVLWSRYRSIGRHSATDFDRWRLAIGYDALNHLIMYCTVSGFDEVDKTVKYLCKINMRSAKAAADMLTDLWGWTEENGTVPEEFKYPRDLVAVHDRIAEQVKQIENEKAQKAFKKEFDRITEKYSALEWTDGELCIILPKSNGDLIEEGKTLRHCVGSYANAHTKENGTVFFVRHYRRPERSYYTMDFNFTKQKPHRNQIHGYGNERHGKNKEYEHKIPKKVLDFADRWEREVLMPWWKNHEKNNKTNKESA